MDFRTWLNNLLVGLKLTDWIIAGFTAVLAVVAILQFREMRKGSKDTHILAEQAVIQSQAALTQATISQKNFDAIFHPSVEVSSITFNQQAVTDNGLVSYTLRNVGSAPAEKLSVRVVATLGGSTNDISPRSLPSELGVGAGFTDDPKVTQKNDTAALLNGNQAMKISFIIRYAAHGQAPVQQCSAFLFEPAKRELFPVRDCK